MLVLENQAAIAAAASAAAVNDVDLEVERGPGQVPEVAPPAREDLCAGAVLGGNLLVVS